MFKTIRNAWAIPDLRKKILFTLLIVLVFRIGSVIPVPFLDMGALNTLMKGVDDSGSMLSYLNTLSGGAFSNATLFAMGVTPYINSSIILQLLCVAIPPLERMAKDGEVGRKKIGKITRYVTVILGLIQGAAYFWYLYRSNVTVYKSGFDLVYSAIIIILVFTAGTALMMGMGEQINNYGIGNGISFIILIGIIARFPDALIQEVVSRVANKSGGLIMFIIEVVFLLLVIGAAILLVQGVRKIPVQYAKRIVGNKQYGGARQYIPLKVNAAGVMPIIFAQAIMFIPITFIGFSNNVNNAGGFLHAFTDHTSFWYNFVFAVMIILFTYFYTAITINPTQMAEDMKRNNGFIPGIKPGKKTAEYIDDIMSRITLPGSFFLALVAIMPAFAGIFGVQAGFAQFFGGTSLLILVGVVLDTLQQVESHLLMRHYDGLLKSGRIKGRAGVAAY